MHFNFNEPSLGKVEDTKDIYANGDCRKSKSLT